MDTLLLGGSAITYRVDDQTDFSVSSETGAELTFQGRMFLDGSPPGECIFRSIYVTVIHRAGCNLFVTPIVDGVRQPHLTTQLVRTTPSGGAEERHTFRVPMASNNTGYSVGVRGTVIELEVTSTAPSSEFHLETTSFGVNPRNRGRGVRTSD